MTTHAYISTWVYLYVRKTTYAVKVNVKRKTVDKRDVHTKIIVLFIYLCPRGCWWYFFFFATPGRTGSDATVSYILGFLRLVLKNKITLNNNKIHPLNDQRRPIVNTLVTRHFLSGYNSGGLKRRVKITTTIIVLPEKRLSYINKNHARTWSVLYRSVFLKKIYYLQNREQPRPVNVRRRFVPVFIGQFIQVKSLKQSTKLMINQLQIVNRLIRSISFDQCTYDGFNVEPL